MLDMRKWRREVNEDVKEGGGDSIYLIRQQVNTFGPIEFLDFK